jgi:hypothetical protein
LQAQAQALADQLRGQAARRVCAEQARRTASSAGTIAFVQFNLLELGSKIIKIGEGVEPVLADSIYLSTRRRLEGQIVTTGTTLRNITEALFLETQLIETKIMRSHRLCRHADKVNRIAGEMNHRIAVRCRRDHEIIETCWLR